MSGSAEEIDAPGCSGMNGLDVHRAEGNSHFRHPNMVLVVNASRVLETGVPSRVVEGFVLLFDFEINPLVIWSHFEFVIMGYAFRLGIQENLGDVAIP